MRRWFGALLGCLLVAAAAVPVAVPVGVPAAPVAATAAADFLKRELVRLNYTYPAVTPGSSDGGLVADTLLGLRAAGQTGDEYARTVQKLRETYFNANLRTSGLIAKYLLVAVQAGVDPKDWGKDSAGKPIDLVQRLGETLDANGRYRNLTATPYDPARDASNVFSQALALIAVHAYDPRADQKAAGDYLVRQQCPSGGFRPAPLPTDPASRCTTDEPLVGVDYTAMAVWALAETGVDKPALVRGVAWLRSQQKDDGGFVGESSENANSTGLAALALTKAGDTAAGGRAAGWLVSMQLPATMTAMAGGIAYNAVKFLEIGRDPAAFWARPASQDQLRRATAQAVLGLLATPATNIPDPPKQPTPTQTKAKPKLKPAASKKTVPTPPQPRPVPVATTGTPLPSLSVPGPAASPVVLAGTKVPHASARPRDDFLRSPWGIGLSVVLVLAAAGAGYWLTTRRGSARR